MFFTPFNFNEPWSRMFLNSMYMVGAASFLSLCGSCLSHQSHHPNTKTESTKRQQPCKSTDYWWRSTTEKLTLFCETRKCRRMTPMWGAFIVFSLVMSTAKIFFSMQADDNMNAHITTYFLLAKHVLKEKL